MPFGNEEAYSDPNSPFYDPVKAAQLAAQRSGAPPMARPMGPPPGMAPGGPPMGAPPGAAAGAAPGAIGGAMAAQAGAGMGAPPGPGAAPGAGMGAGMGAGDELDPQLMADVLKLGTLKSRSQRLGDKLRMAQEMSGTAMPEGRAVGGQYRAAHPLEFLGSLAQRAAGKYQEGKLGDQFAPIEAEQEATRGRYLQAKLRQPIRRNAQVSSAPSVGATDETGSIY